MTKDCTGII